MPTTRFFRHIRWQFRLPAGTLIDVETAVCRRSTWEGSDPGADWIVRRLAPRWIIAVRVRV
jgi:hypothetical protein